MPDKKGSAEEADMFSRLTRMIEGLEKKIESSEASTAAKIGVKIDGLSEQITARLNKAEDEIASLSTQITRVRATVSDENLQRLVDRAVERRNLDPGASRRPRTLGRRESKEDGTDHGEPAQPHTDTDPRELKYWEARRQLRFWPVPGPDLEASVRDFLTNKLLMQADRVRRLTFKVEPIDARHDSPAQDVAVVTFETARLRDEAKSRAKNLDGTDRTTGCQLEPPDHLRRQYQVFQNLAFCLKKKNPRLRRNIKFNDASLSLHMDVKTEDGWKTIEFETAKSILKNKAQNSTTLSKKDLKGIMNESDQIRSESSSDESMSTDPPRTGNNKQNNKRLPKSITHLNINARSLKPKIQGLADCFEEKLVDFATLTETWIQSGSSRQELVDEFRDRFSLGLLTRERTTIANNGRQYGGVALVYRLKTSSFETFPLSNPDNHEIHAAVGTVKGVKGKIFVLSCYAPPNLTSDQAKHFLEYLSDVVCEAKRTIDDVMIVVSGDFNQWPAESLTSEHPDLKEVDVGPTREGRKIDRSFVNFSRAVVSSGCLPPLDTEDGRPSDHKIAHWKAVFPSSSSKKITYTYRPYSEEGAAQFLLAVATQSWDSVLSNATVDGKTEAYQKILEKLTNLYFPLRTTTRRESDPPWVNDTIRRMVMKRRRVYDRQGRSAKWKALKKRSDDLFRERAFNFNQRQKELLTGPEADKHFHKHVKAYKCREKPPDFEVRDLFPGSTDKEAAEELASHFNAISNEFNGVEPGQIPAAESNPPPLLTTAEVKQRLVSFKKAKSMVPGDVFPSLVNRMAEWISVPLTDIYNAITTSQTWPSIWKREYVTPIPKKGLPQCMNDLRNISCTNLFSKVYESFVLPWLTGQTGLRSNQYGGVRGCGTEHFLLELWQRVLEDLDDSRSGTFLTTIDYAKAFNRLDFVRCLEALKEKGASKELINIVASFLSGRKMAVKVGSDFSTFRSVEGGVPQGSLLGVYLFNLTIDSFESSSPDVENYGPVPDPQPPAQAALDQLVEAPVVPPVLRRDHKHLPPFRERLLQVLKYVDDIIISERINFDKMQTDGHSRRDYHATRSQNLFRRIVAVAEAFGMKVNAAKTATLCISDLKSYVPGAHILDQNGNTTELGENMKILGLQFSSRPDMSAQVADIRKKFVSRMWALRHLGHRGFDADDLLRVYKSCILPCHDYCSVVYHSSLTAVQTQSLERLQSQALKCIYGYEYSYRALLEMSGLTSLHDRRERRCTKFALKTVNNPRFSHWFPLEEHQRQLRHQNHYVEERARTSRLMKSPIYDLRRRLNRMHA